MEAIEPRGRGEGVPQAGGERPRSSRLLVLIGSFGCILLALMALAGWGTGTRVLTSLLPGGTPMMPLTAVGFLLGGTAALALLPARDAARRVARAIGLVVVLVGGVSLLGSFASLAGSFDLLLFPGEVRAAELPGQGWPGPNTAVNLLLLGGALLTLSYAGAQWVRTGHALALLSAVLSLLALLGYAFGAERLYGIAAYTPMAFPSTVSALLLAMAALALRPHEGFLAVVTSRRGGGLIARPLLTAAVVVPVLLGWLRLMGERAGYYDTAFGVSVMVVGSMVAFGGMVWFTARYLEAVEERRERIEAALSESDRRFRSVAENASEAIVSIDADDHVVLANPAAAEVFGYTREQLYTMKFSQLMPERFRERHRAGVARYLATGERRIPWDGIELPGLTADGREVPLEVTFSEYTRDGEHFFTGVMRDISQRKRTDEERARLLELEKEARGEAERRARQEGALREAIAAVSAAFTVEETTGRIAERALQATRADAAYVERVDMDRGELVVAAVAGESAPPLGSRMSFQHSYTQRVLEREEPLVIPCVGESELALPDHIREYCSGCSAAVIPLLNAGEPIGALVLLREAEKMIFRPDELARAFSFGSLASLAFRKMHMLEESERRREELQRVTESRARLVRGFSHDVKNPLGAADGYLSLLEEGVGGALPDQQLDSIQRVRRLLGSALGLIEDLLELARAEAGQLELQYAPTDVRHGVREITEEFRAQAEGAGLTLRLEIPEELPLTKSDPARVRQVVSNLLSNAVKYNRPGGHIRVAVGLDPVPDDVGEGAWLAISVQDTGIGISPEQRELLFQEFMRLDTASEQKGAGIGLAIAQRIAHALEGEITVESEVDKGSTFTLWLPLREPGDGGPPSSGPPTRSPMESNPQPDLSSSRA